MKKHKHWFQFVKEYEQCNLKSKKKTGKESVQFICLCGEQRIVEIKKAEIPKKK